LRAAVEAVVEQGGRAPVVLDVRVISGFTDWVLIASGRSDRHVGAITDRVLEAAHRAGVRPLGVDGLEEHTWDLVDYDDFMVHVFYHPVRLHYDLESMWSDAPRVELGLPDDVMHTADLDELQPPQTMPSFRGDKTFGGYDDEFEAMADDEEFDDDDDDDTVDALDDDDDAASEDIDDADD
jgi:ribosome-associated protein